MRRRRCPWAGVDARERGLARRYTARANPYHDDRCAISRGTIEPIQHRPKCHQKHCAPEAATIFEGTKAHRRARHVDRYHRGGRVESRVAERLGNACREARPQPDRDSGWISRLHRPGGIPTATSSSTTSASADGTPSFDGKPANTWSWTRQPQRNLCQPHTGGIGGIGGASQRRRDSDGQVPSGVRHQAHDALTTHPPWAEDRNGRQTGRPPLRPSDESDCGTTRLKAGDFGLLSLGGMLSGLKLFDRAELVHDVQGCDFVGLREGRVVEDRVD